MAYDGEEIVYTREIGRVGAVPKVISYIESNAADFAYWNPGACVIGMARQALPQTRGYASTSEIGAQMGMSPRQSWETFIGGGGGAASAIRMLRYYQRTGKVAWNPVARFFGMGVA